MKSYFTIEVLVIIMPQRGKIVISGPAAEMGL
jgi:hypothetical protein